MIDHLSEYLLIVPGGRLLMKHGGFSKEPFEKDVTKDFMRLLPMQCRFAETATLKDLFHILRPKQELLEEIFGHHCDKFIEEAFSQECPPEPGAWLEIYWWADTSMGILEGLEFPSIHEIVGSSDPEPASTRALGFVPTYKFINEPVKLKHRATIYDWKKGPKPVCEEITFDVGFTLFQIIYGIFWELSFYANPTNREQKITEILGEINERTNRTNLE